MKTNISSTVLCAILLALFLVRTEADIKRECRLQSHAPWAALKKLNNGDFEQDDLRVKCYLRCFMMKNGILDENERVDWEKAVRHLPRAMQKASRDTYNQCENSATGEHKCERVFEVAKCYVKLQPQILNYVSFV